MTAPDDNDIPVGDHHDALAAIAIGDNHISRKLRIF